MNAICKKEQRRGLKSVHIFVLVSVAFFVTWRIFSSVLWSRYQEGLSVCFTLKIARPQKHAVFWLVKNAKYQQEHWLCGLFMHFEASVDSECRKVRVMNAFFGSHDNTCPSVEMFSLPRHSCLAVCVPPGAVPGSSGGRSGISRPGRRSHYSHL